MKKLPVVESRYLHPLTDFGFHRLFGTESCKELLIDFLNEVIKDEGRITSIQYLPPEQWGYSRNEFKDDKEHVIEYVHLVRERTKTLYSKKLNFVFVELPKFKKREEELSKEDMKEYRKSILKYQDVRDAVDLAREEGIEEGIIFIIQKCLQKNMPVEDIVDITGFSLEQIGRYIPSTPQPPEGGAGVCL